VVFRLVAADLDGTLLGPGGDIGPRTRAVVKELHVAGVAFALATSRRFTGTAPVAQALGLAGPVIVYDGAQTRAYPGGEILAEQALAPEVATAAAAILAAHHLRPIVQYADAASEYLRVGPPDARNPHVSSYLARFADQVSVHALGDLCSLDASPLRVAAFGPSRRLRRAAAGLGTLPCGVQLLGEGGYGAAELTVFSPAASKGAALLDLASTLGIAVRETFAIGDGRNDMSMLRAAGMSVAMAHADRRTRASARIVAAIGDDAVTVISRMVLAGQLELSRDAV
jgi:hydroxymethylpyrimidine pyrophosphatase-like HAD family hydrolase